MKRFLLVFIPLALFIGFLAIKPPAVDAKITTPSATTSDPKSTPANGKPAIGKPGITGGEDDDGEKNKEKPSYGGHDEDNYDD